MEDKLLPVVLHMLGSLPRKQRIIVKFISNIPQLKRQNYPPNQSRSTTQSKTSCTVYGIPPRMLDRHQKHFLGNPKDLNLHEYVIMGFGTTHYPKGLCRDVPIWWFLLDPQDSVQSPQKDDLILYLLYPIINYAFLGPAQGPEIKLDGCPTPPVENTKISNPNRKKALTHKHFGKLWLFCGLKVAMKDHASFGLVGLVGFVVLCCVELQVLLQNVFGGTQPWGAKPEVCWEKDMENYIYGRIME